MTEQQIIAEFVKAARDANLLVNFGPNHCHYVEQMEQASNGKLVVHAWNRGSSPQLSFCLLDINAPIWIQRNL